MLDFFCENMDPYKWDTTMWYQVTRNPQEFRGLMGCQRDPQIWGVIVIWGYDIFIMFFSSHCGANNYPFITKNNYLEPIILSFLIYVFLAILLNPYLCYIFTCFQSYLMPSHILFFFFHKFNRDLNFMSFFHKFYSIFSFILLPLLKGLKYRFQRIYQYLEFTDVSKISDIRHEKIPIF